jgi:hypothetical protein
MENRLTPVAARHHVVISTGKFKAVTSGHAGWLGKREGLSRFAPRFRKTNDFENVSFTKGPK